VGGDLSSQKVRLHGCNGGIPVSAGYIGPWFFDQRCPHGRIVPYRWVGDTEDSSEPEYGRNGCKKCEQEE